MSLRDKGKLAPNGIAGKECLLCGRTIPVGELAIEMKDDGVTTYVCQRILRCSARRKEQDKAQIRVLELINPMRKD